GSTIDPRNYWCIDVSRDAIAQGSAAHPEAHFVFYDRYNWAFNPTGTEALPIPDLGMRFDVIVAYSVFTHTNQRETRELVDQLRPLLAPGGTIAFTFIDPSYRQSQEPGDGYFDGTNLEWRLRKAKSINPHIDVEAMKAKARGASWITLVNDERLYVDDEDADAGEFALQTGYHTCCSPAYIRAMLPGAVVVAPPRDAYPPPIAYEMQHCCLLRA
ncbi:MAG: Methyltransferase domain, partial [Thermoanaerobaculia bacterium]|nr:Methyltransferase domain [Thermoanaerobaculia bacterium]